jgi:hypothetical protein
MPTIQDGTSGVADLSAVTSAQDRGIDEPLKDPSDFKQAHLEMGVVTWSNGADLDLALMDEELTQFKTCSVPEVSAEPKTTARRTWVPPLSVTVQKQCEQP